MRSAMRREFASAPRQRRAERVERLDHRRSNSNDFRRSVFSRSMRRGKTLTMPFGASVSSSGAVSQANTIAGTRHLPACANTLVTSVSEMPSTHLATVFEVAGATTRVW